MTSFGRPAQALIFVAAAVLFIAIRLVHLNADPPSSLPNGHPEASELVVEGPAKAHEARNKALFGDWKAHPANEYQFWRIQSPVWVYPLSWAFRAFGVGYAQLRVFSILTAALGLLGVLLIAARRNRGVPLLFAGLLLSLNYYYVFYSRAGLLEPLLNGFLALTAFFLLLAIEAPLWLIAAQVALVLALLTKQTALVMLPVFLIGHVLAFHRARRSKRPWWSWALPISTLVVFATALGIYVTSDAYWSVLVSNLGHALFDDVWVSRIELSRAPIGEIFARAFDWPRWRDGFFLLLPVAAPLILVELWRIGRRLVVARRLDGWDAIVSLWFFSVLAMLQITPLTSLRYYVILVVPGVLLAAGGLALILQWASRWHRGPTAVAVATLAAVMLTHGRWWNDWARSPSHVLGDTNQDIVSQIGDREAAIIGAWAAPLAFETPYKTYYVKHRFNTSREALMALEVTHFLVRHRGDPFDWFSRDDWTFWTVRHLFPDAVADGEPLAQYRLWDGTFVDLRAANLPAQ